MVNEVKSRVTVGGLSGQAMNPVRLLIVEENPSVRQALVTRLSSVPQVEVLASAGDAKEAQRLTVQLSPDVILVEPKRLDGQGIALIHALASAPCNPMVMVLTSYYDENEELIAGLLGISHYMLKDIDSQALVEAIIAAREEPDDG
jgi:DNA-binding NarL/FixJ family response regulator